MATRRFFSDVLVITVACRLYSVVGRLMKVNVEHSWNGSSGKTEVFREKSVPMSVCTT